MKWAVAVTGWLVAAVLLVFIYLLFRGPGSYGNCVRADLGKLDTPENRMVVYTAIPDACFSFKWDPDREIDGVQRRPLRSGHR